MKLTLEKISIILLICTNVATGIMLSVQVYRKNAAIDKVRTLELKMNDAEMNSRLLLHDLELINERTEMLDSLHKNNVKKRNDEKIHLIQSANDSTIKRIVLEHIRTK